MRSRSKELTVFIGGKPRLVYSTIMVVVSTLCVAWLLMKQHHRYEQSPHEPVLKLFSRYQSQVPLLLGVEPETGSRAAHLCV